MPYFRSSKTNKSNINNLKHRYVARLSSQSIKPSHITPEMESEFRRRVEEAHKKLEQNQQLFMATIIPSKKNNKNVITAKEKRNKIVNSLMTQSHRSQSAGSKYKKSRKHKTRKHHRK